jgi:hypothetical protein
MNLPDFEQENDQEKTNIVQYHYKYLAEYLGTKKTEHTEDWIQGTLNGQLYENIIYEKLLHWAIKTEEVTDFILKGPYIISKKERSDGFVYDGDGNIYYISSRETIGEFDALFKYNECYYFVEMTNTRYETAIDSLIYEIIRKNNLLKIVFPGNETACLLITTFNKHLALQDLPFINQIVTPKYQLDPRLLIGVTNRQNLIPPNNDKFKMVKQINCHHFDYLSTLETLNNHITDIAPEKLKDELINLISPYIGLIERIFLGKMAIKEFSNWLIQHNYRLLDDRLRINEVFLTLKIKEATSAKLTFYLTGEDNHFFEIVDLTNLKVNPIEPRKRSTRDITNFASKLRTLSDGQMDKYLSIFD